MLLVFGYKNQTGPGAAACQSTALPPEYWLCMTNRQMRTLGVVKGEQQIPGKNICCINPHQNPPL